MSDYVTDGKTISMIAALCIVMGLTASCTTLSSPTMAQRYDHVVTVNTEPSIGRPKIIVDGSIVPRAQSARITLDESASGFELRHTSGQWEIDLSDQDVRALLGIEATREYPAHLNAILDGSDHRPIYLKKQIQLIIQKPSAIKSHTSSSRELMGVGRM